jgi:hypothetical protein
VNPSQEPAQPQRSEQSFADPTAEPAVGSESSVWSREGGGPAATGEGPAATGGGAPGTADAAAGSSSQYEQPVAGGEGGYGLAHPSGPGDPYGVAAAGYDGEQWAEAAVARRPWRRTAVVAVLSGLAIVVLGGPLGLIWAWLAPSVPVLDAGQGGIVVNDPSPEEYIAADGWYTLLGLGFGLLVAIVVWLVLRRDRGPFLLLGVVLGTLGAGYLVGPWIGGLIGKGNYQHWQETAAQGATYFAPPQVHSVGPKLVPAFAAAIVLTLLAGWSNDPDLDQPGAKPGYRPNVATADPVTAGDLHESETGARPATGPAAG